MMEQNLQLGCKSAQRSLIFYNNFIHLLSVYSINFDLFFIFIIYLLFLLLAFIVVDYNTTIMRASLHRNFLIHPHVILRPDNLVACISISLVCPTHNSSVFAHTLCLFV